MENSSLRTRKILCSNGFRDVLETQPNDASYRLQDPKTLTYLKGGIENMRFQPEYGGGARLRLDLDRCLCGKVKSAVSCRGKIFAGHRCRFSGVIWNYRQFSDMKKGEPGRTLLIAAADWEKAMGNTKSLGRKTGRASSRLGNKAAGGGDPLRHV